MFPVTAMDGDLELEVINSLKSNEVIGSLSHDPEPQLVHCEMRFGLMERAQWAMAPVGNPGTYE